MKAVVVAEGGEGRRRGSEKNRVIRERVANNGKEGGQICRTKVADYRLPTRQQVVCTSRTETLPDCLDISGKICMV